MSQRPVQIDAHQHFWNPARGDYGWMPKDDPILARPYSPADLAPHLVRQGIDATVLVQAAASVNETEYLLGIADATPFVAAVVGWVDFDRDADLAQLRRLAAHPKLRGIRPMIQDIPDVGWMLRDDVQWGFRAICDLGLTFDALGFPRHLAHFLTLMKRYPDMRVVVDHGMKPQIRDRSEATFAHWADGMARIANHTGAYCKLSGLVTEANIDWTLEDLRPYAEHIFEVFGPERVMWGSDWPVCQQRLSYQAWHETARQLTAPLGTTAEAWIYGKAAAAFYGLDV